MAKCAPPAAAIQCLLSCCLESGPSRMILLIYYSFRLVRDCFQKDIGCMSKSLKLSFTLASEMVKCLQRLCMLYTI
eukprot:scaffold1054_cov159-Skeletonema_marinoi.AAC.2